MPEVFSRAKGFYPSWSMDFEDRDTCEVMFNLGKIVQIHRDRKLNYVECLAICDFPCIEFHAKLACPASACRSRAR